MTEAKQAIATDVVVVGSGAGGMLAAIRLADLGLKPILIEKEHKFGGTSATSGGFVWIPNHGRPGNESDSREDALTYLSRVCKGDFRQDRVDAYVDRGKDMVRYLDEIGITLDVIPFPDYFRDEPGATDSRMIGARELDAAELGEQFFELREAANAFKLFNRYTLDLGQAFAFAARPRGWQLVAARMFAKYWLDLGWRRKSYRDRRLTLGAALVGRLRKAMLERGIELSLNTRLVRIVEEDGRVTGVEVTRNDVPMTMEARYGVILAAGGFEQNQQMRDRHLPVRTDARWSQTPKGANVGDAILAGQAIGAATESMDCCWWAPSMQLPSREVANVDVTHQMWLDHKHPNSVCVNRLGKRFVNEGCSYDRFGLAMIEDQKASGANVPCWMIFDATYRKHYTAGGILPSTVTPDRSIPRDWWDHYLYRADTIEELAAKIDLDPVTLRDTVGRMNDYARTGVDLEFHRGESSYDRYFGDARVGPNPCLGPVDKPPFYAVRVDLGDLGGKGGLKADASARVLDQADKPIEGLYAIGNCSGAPFGNAYPGAGSTLGPATVFGFIAANHIATRANIPTARALSDRVGEYQ